MEEEEAARLKKAYGDALYEEDPEQEESTCKLDDDNRIIKVADLNNISEALSLIHIFFKFGVAVQNLRCRFGCGLCFRIGCGIRLYLQLDLRCV